MNSTSGQGVGRHNDRVKAALTREEGDAARHSLWSRLDLPKLLAVLVVLVGLAAWRATWPAVDFEKPPASLQVTALRTTEMDGQVFLECTIRNATGRRVAKAYWQVGLGGTGLRVLLPLTELPAGEARDVKMALPELKKAESNLTLAPYSIGWGD